MENSFMSFGEFLSAYHDVYGMEPIDILNIKNVTVIKDTKAATEVIYNGSFKDLPIDIFNTKCAMVETDDNWENVTVVIGG